jgi:fibronectin-binding autotransporter adhesin
VDNAISSGAVTVSGVTAELAMNTFNDTVGTVILDSDGLISGTAGASGTLTSTGSFQVKDGTVNAVLGGDGIALNKTTAGTVTLTNQNTFTGNTVINAGTLILEGVTAPNLASSNVVIVARNATLVVNNDNTVTSLTSSGTLSGNKTLTAATYNLNDGAQVSAILGNAVDGSTLNSNGAVTLSNLIAATLVNVQTGTLNLTAADILAHAATVDIATFAALALTGGDQTIEILNGGGTLILNGNNLNVSSGGTYTGTATTNGSLSKTGTGTLDLSGNNTFTQGIEVSSGTLTIAAGSTQTTLDTVINAGSLLINNGIITNSVLVNTGGRLKGSGTFTGSLTGNGTTSPGNSPGVMTVVGDYVENGSLEIEVWGTGGAGVNPTGHDQVAVGGATFLNAATSSLDLVKDGGSFEPAKGDKFTIIQGAPGSISGSFATFTSGFTNDLILNRSTGQLVGTGLLTASTGSNLTNAFPGASSNLQSMVRGLKVGDHQYAGGDLMPLLLSANTAADVEVLGNRASPEVYAGLSSYAGRVSTHYTDSALNMSPMAQTENFEIFAGYTTLDAGSVTSVNQADYAFNSKGAITGARVALTPRFTAGAFVGIDSGLLSSTYMSGNVKGHVYGLVGEYVAGEKRKFIVSGSLSTASYTSDGARATAGAGIAAPGLSHFKDVDTSAHTASLGIKYIALQRSNFVIQPELRVSYADSKVGAIRETNANVLQALNVHSQSTRTFTTEAAISGSFQVNPKFRLNGRVGVGQNNGDTSRAVTANVLSEAESFSVRSPGMGRSTYSLGLGAQYSVHNDLKLSAFYSKSMASNAKDSDALFLNAVLSF